MQLEGASKRKRRSSASDGDIENSPLCEAKRPREDDRPSPQEDIDHLASEERLPLTELPVGQPFDDSDGSDTEWTDDGWDCSPKPVSNYRDVLHRRVFSPFSLFDDSDGSYTEWLEACEDLSVDEEEEEEEDDREKLGGSEGEGNASADENQEPPQKILRTNDNYFEQNLPSRSDSFGRNFFSSSRHFASVTELMNFFKRKVRATEDRADRIFSGNPGLQPKMRSVLLEWIVEVCDVYKLHRETYHLTVDYLDRYLCQSENISKGQLQLIGVTALLIAAKYEEIYPPKISDFAYITDGACTDQDIVKMENLMIQVLEWRCTVITSNAWVLGFLQLLCVHEKKDCESRHILVPQYNHLIYETIMHLLDLCSLDCGFVKFSYKVLALSSVHVVMPNPDPVILKVSGYAHDDLVDCIDWMQPFWTVLCKKFNYEAMSSGALGNNESIGRASDFSHMRIKHNIDLDMLEAVQAMIEAKEKNDVIPELLLTPPSSSEKRKGSNKKEIQVDTSNGTVVLM